MAPSKDDVCNKCGNKGHWARDCDVSFDSYYKRSGKADKTRVYLDVSYRDKDYAKSFGARWDADKRKWFVWDRVPDELKRFEPIRMYTYVKPEETIDDLCRYCFFSFEERLAKSESDPKACVHCAPKKRPPACKHCNKFMVADTWTGNMDDESIVVIHDCVGNPMMYDGGCSSMGGCRHRLQSCRQNVLSSAIELALKDDFWRKCGERTRNLIRDSYNAAVKELSSEFLEFETVSNSRFYTGEDHGMALFGIHFRIGKEYDDEKIKTFAQRGMHEHDGSRGYLPHGFDKHVAERLSDFEPWRLVKRPEPGCYVFVVGHEMLDSERDREIKL